MLFAILIFLNVSCKKESDQIAPIILKITTSENITVYNEMSFKAHFIKNGKLVKSLDVKLGDNTIYVPKAKYSNIVVTSHDFSDYSSTTVNKYPEILTHVPVSSYLPRRTTRFILHGEMPIDFTNNNNASIELQSHHKLVMIRKNDSIGKAPLSEKDEYFKEVTDEDGQIWYALYFHHFKSLDDGKPYIVPSRFQIAVKLNNGELDVFNLMETVELSTVIQLTFNRNDNSYTKDIFSYRDYDHQTVMSTTSDWVRY